MPRNRPPKARQRGFFVAPMILMLSLLSLIGMVVAKRGDLTMATMASEDAMRVSGAVLDAASGLRMAVAQVQVVYGPTLGLPVPLKIVDHSLVSPTAAFAETFDVPFAPGAGPWVMSEKDRLILGSITRQVATMEMPAAACKRFNISAATTVPALTTSSNAQGGTDYAADFGINPKTDLFCVPGMGTGGTGLVFSGV